MKGRHLQALSSKLSDEEVFERHGSEPYPTPEQGEPPRSKFKKNPYICDQSAEPWPEVIPLSPSRSPATSFPREALGPILRPAADAMEDAIRAPYGLCGQAVLAAASLAYAGHADVLIDGRTYPNTDFFMTIALSGERKDSVDKAALRPHRRYEEKLRAQHSAEKAAYENRKKNKNDTEEATKMPVPPVLAIGDTTIEGLQGLFGTGVSRLGIFTTEAGNILSGWSMSSEQRIRTAAALSKFWDGSPDLRARGTSGLLLLANRRLTAHFACQPFVASSFLGASDLDSQGLLARFLPCWPDSTIGTRSYASIDLSREKGYERYVARMTELLEKPLPLSLLRPGELEPPVLTLDSQAAKLWVLFHDAVEIQAGQGGRLCEIQPFACKAAEHALRLAAVLAAVASHEQIIESTMECAIALVNFYLAEWQGFRLSFRQDPDVGLALCLLEWCKRKQRQFFTVADVCQKGPEKLRSASVARRAINLLSDHQIVRSARFEQAGKTVSGFEVRYDV